MNTSMTGFIYDFFCAKYCVIYILLDRIKSNKIKTNVAGFRVVFKSVCALDESSLSIGGAMLTSLSVVRGKCRLSLTS